jgi:hypothetical protein
MCAIQIDVNLHVRYLLKGQDGLCGVDEIDRLVG